MSPSEPTDSGETFHGPANWFSLRCPQELEFHRSDAFLEFRERGTVSPDDSRTPASKESERDATWTMTLYAAWVDEESPETRAEAFGVETLFPDVRQSESTAPPNVGGRCRSWAGVSRHRQDATWWKRLLGHSSDYAWRLWIVEYQQIILVASLQSVAGEILSASTVTRCESVLQSITFSEQLSLPPDLFRRDVIRLARKHFPLLQIEASGGFGVKVADTEINLSNFYRSYLLQPDQFRQIVLPGITTVVRLQEWGPDQLMPPLSSVADRIMPMLYPEAEAEAAMKDFAQVSWVGGLTVMFVLDESETYRFVHSRMLAAWELSVTDLQEMAMTNLEKFSRENPLEVRVLGEPNDPGILVPAHPGAYNTSRLLGQHLHMRLRELLGAEVVVGTPNRDFFVAVSLRHPYMVKQVQQQVARDYESMQHPLTSRLLVISADGVSEYCDP